MKEYQRYMDRQQVGEELHQKLLELERPKKQAHWARWGALAACCALIVGVGVWRLSPGVPGQNDSQFPADQNAEPGIPDVFDSEDLPQLHTAPMQPPERDFVVSSPADRDQIVNFFAMPAIYYQDVTGAPELAASRAFAPGTFLVDLTKEDIQDIFWGDEGKPEDSEYDLPWALFWDGYTVYGYAWYDGEGRLTELSIYGERGRSAFTLELRVGALPFTCCVDLSREDEISEWNGVEVAGWSKVYDRDGDGQTDYMCGSEFMTQSSIGVRFVSWNNGKAEDGVGGEAWFNTLFVRQALPDGLYLDHLMTAESIPAWREVDFETLAQARQEMEFAPYLPTAEPEGYSAYVGNKEFYAHLSYQEGTQNTLWVRWSRGYDDVQVSICRDGYQTCALADPNNPASYDVRLYEIPWCDSVPEEYRETVDCPAFFAQDMSLDIVEARGHEKDTGGLTFRFDVVHPDGTVVRYHCAGLTAEQVWAMVEETLT